MENWKTFEAYWKKWRDTKASDLRFLIAVSTGVQCVIKRGEFCAILFYEFVCTSETNARLRANEQIHTLKAHATCLVHTTTWTPHPALCSFTKITRECLNFFNFGILLLRSTVRHCSTTNEKKSETTLAHNGMVYLYVPLFIKVRFSNLRRSIE